MASLKTKCPRKCHFVSVSNAENIESSSPLFIPAKPEKKSVRRRRTRKHIKEGGSTDSEDLVGARAKGTSKRKRRRGQINQKDSKGKTAGSNKGEDRRDGEGSERSAVTEKSEGRREQKQQKHVKTANDVAAPQTEPLPSNKTPKTPSECSSWFDSSLALKETYHVGI